MTKKRERYSPVLRLSDTRYSANIPFTQLNRPKGNGDCCLHICRQRSEIESGPTRDLNIWLCVACVQGYGIKIEAAESKS